MRLRRQTRLGSALFGATCAFVLVAASPAAACPGHHLLADLTGYPVAGSVSGQATLTMTHDHLWSGRVTVTGLAAGNYTSAVVVNDEPAPGGGGHFTLVNICTLHVVAPTKAARCQNGSVVLPTGVPIAGSMANVNDEHSLVAYGRFVES